VALQRAGGDILFSFGRWRCAARLPTAVADCTASGPSSSPAAASNCTTSGTAPREMKASFLCLLPGSESKMAQRSGGSAAAKVEGHTARVARALTAARARPSVRRATGR
jgi:hypothetical protein